MESACVDAILTGFAAATVRGFITFLTPCANLYFVTYQAKNRRFLCGAPGVLFR
ncbi:hypothetical protein SABO8233_00780 [Salmonella bongori]